MNKRTNTNDAAQEICVENDPVIDLRPTQIDCPQLRARIEPTAEQAARFDAIDPDFAATVAIEIFGARLSRAAVFHIGHMRACWRRQHGIDGVEGWRRFDIDPINGSFLAVGPANAADGEQQLIWVPTARSKPRRVHSTRQLIRILDREVAA